MQFPAVNWHEGLFLQPHHFQAWDRHWTERVSVGEQWQTPYGYGVLDIQINSDALAAGFLQVDLLRCKTPGGTLIDCGHGQISERRDLRPSIEQISASTKPSERIPSSQGHPLRASSYVDVYVGVPRLMLGSKNVDPPDHLNGARYRAQWLDLPDELDAACVKPVELRHLNARILLSTDDLAGYDALRIARVRRSDQEGVQMKLDGQYIPPLLDCSAWGPMRTQILSSLYDLMQQASEQCSMQLNDAGGSLHANTPIDVQRLLILQMANPAASVLQVLLQSRGIHPLTAYLELVRISGMLDLLHPQRMAKPTAAYDHENLGGIFFELKRRILSNIEGMQRSPYQHSMFVGNSNGMQIALDRSVFGSKRRWYLGVRKGECNAEAIYQLLESGSLDWKLGSLPQIERLFAQRAAGVEWKRSIQVPAVLPKSEEWIYYEIVGTDRPAWKDVEATGSLAMRICESRIVDRETLPGSRAITLSDGTRRITLQFALFGVG